MKNFFKKVAFVLALAMVLTNIGPAATASAAEAPSLKYTSKILYVGGSHFGDYTDNCWTPSQNYQGYTVTYSTNSKIIDLNTKNGKITANGTGVGLAVVNVTYTPVGGGQSIPATFNVKVRRNATDVKLAQATVDALKIEEGLSVGAEVTLKAAKSGTTPVSYKTGSFGWDNYRGVVTDQVAYEVSNPDVIKVEGNTLTAVGAGEATLKVYTYEYLGASKDVVKEREYPITVIGGLLAAEQTTVTTIKVSMGQSVADAKADDFSVTRVSDTVDFGIKSIDISSDGLTVIIETFNNMDDGGEYKVSYDGKDVTFKATDGKVADMKPNKEFIPYNFATTISVDLLDSNGVVISTVKESTASNYNVEWTWTSLNGVTDGDKIVLYERNATAEFTVTYRPGSYVDGKEVGVIGPRTFKVTAMDVAIDASMKATINGAANGICVYGWPGVTENKTIYAEEDKYLHIYITDPDGNDLTQNLFNDYGYYLESSNENVLIVDPQSDHNHTQWNGGHYIDDVGVYAEIHAVKPGTVNILVKNANGKVAFTIPVTVGAARRFVGFDIDNTNLTLMDAGLSNNGDITVTANDQYGKATWPEDNSNYLTIEYQSGSNSTNYPVYSIGSNWTWTTGNNSINFNANGCDVGTYRYKIVFERNNVTATKYVTVTVRDSSKGSDSYKIVINGDTDSKYDGGSSRSTGIRVAHYVGGMLFDYLTYAENSSTAYIKELTISNGKYGTIIESYVPSATVTGPVIAKAGTAIESGSVGFGIDKVSTMSSSDRYAYSITNAFEEYIYGGTSTVTGNVIKKAVNGTRTVKAVVVSNGKEITITGNFTVSNSQEIMTATVDTTSIRMSRIVTDTVNQKSTIEAVIKEALTFKHEGYKEINDYAEDKLIVVRYINSSISAYNGKDGSAPVSIGDKITVTSILIGYDRNEKGEYVEYLVPVNRTFTIIN